MELIVLMFIGVGLLIGLAGFALWIFSLIHTIQNERLDSTMKLVWVLLIIFLSPIGSILYFLVGRNPSGSQYAPGPNYGGTNYGGTNYGGTNYAGPQDHGHDRRDDDPPWPRS